MVSANPALNSRPQGFYSPHITNHVAIIATRTNHQQKSSSKQFAWYMVYIVYVVYMGLQLYFLLQAVLRGTSHKLSLLPKQNASQLAIGAVNELEIFRISLFQERTVHEFLWGYNDSTFSMVASQLTRSSIPSEYALQVCSLAVLYSHFERLKVEPHDSRT